MQFFSSYSPCSNFYNYSLFKILSFSSLVPQNMNNFQHKAKNDLTPLVILLEKWQNSANIPYLVDFFFKFTVNFRSSKISNSKKLILPKLDFWEENISFQIDCGHFRITS
jgi:hypothetical protein